MNRFTLIENENNEIRQLIHSIKARFSYVEDQTFLSEIGILAHDLPRRLRAFIHDFRYFEEGKAYCIISGYPIDQQVIGNTPTHWAKTEDTNPAHDEEIFLMLCGTLLGDPIGWATQQAGALVHNIMPMKCYENEQLGFSSKEALTWHVEDAFHEYRGDYLGMMCMRNHQQVPTVLGSISDICLGEESVEVLFQPHYTIRPDNSHLETNNISEEDSNRLQSCASDMKKREEKPDKIAVFYGDPKAPYMRLDPYFMDPPENPLAERAFNALIEQMETKLEEIALDEGDLILVNNHRAVHGRVPFQANYDGNDRWLKRINIVRDLSKSRDARQSATARMIM